MKKLFTLTIALIFSLSTLAQSEQDVILGDWYNQEKDAIIKIFKEGGKYHGKSTWMLNPLDENGNPIYNESGKVMKGPKYFKPDLSKFIKQT